MTVMREKMGYRYLSSFSLSYQSLRLIGLLLKAYYFLMLVWVTARAGFLTYKLINVKAETISEGYLRLKICGKYSSVAGVRGRVPPRQWKKMSKSGKNGKSQEKSGKRGTKSGKGGKIEEKIRKIKTGKKRPKLGRFFHFAPPNRYM